MEIIVDYGLSDIVSQCYDAGARLGGQVEKDMIAVRIAPDLRMAVVATPDYFSSIAPPQVPQEFSQHKCISLRLLTKDGLLAWKFKKAEHEVKVHVQGQLVFNSSVPILRVALAGFDEGWIPEDMAQEHIVSGRLKRVLED